MLIRPVDIYLCAVWLRSRYAFWLGIGIGLVTLLAICMTWAYEMQAIPDTLTVREAEPLYLALDKQLGVAIVITILSGLLIASFSSWLTSRMFKFAGKHGIAEAKFERATDLLRWTRYDLGDARFTGDLARSIGFRVNPGDPSKFNKLINDFIARSFKAADNWILGSYKRHLVTEALEALQSITPDARTAGNASYLTGLIYLRVSGFHNLDEAKRYLKLATEHEIPNAKIELANLWLAEADIENHDKASQLLEEAAFELGFDNLNESTQELLIRIRNSREKEEAEFVTRQMITSFIFHTLQNTVSGNEGKLQRIAKRLSSAPERLSVAAATARTEILGLTANIAMTQSLVDAMKTWASNPETIRAAWANDTSGSSGVDQVLALAVRQALAGFILFGNMRDEVTRLLPNVNITELESRFLEEAMTVDLLQTGTARPFLDWVARYFPFVLLEPYKAEGLRFSLRGPRFIVLFAIVAELLGNAIKYGTLGKQTILTIEQVEERLELVCTNNFDDSSRQGCKGGGRGISFISELCNLVGGRFSTTTDANRFIATAILEFR